MTSKSKIIKFIHLVLEEFLLKPQIVLGKDIKMNGVWSCQVKPFLFLLVFEENSIFPLKERYKQVKAKLDNSRKVKKNGWNIFIIGHIIGPSLLDEASSKL